MFCWHALTCHMAHHLGTTDVTPNILASSSSATGPGGREGGEGATKSEPLHRYPQRGS